jgi:alkylation response protein AidB-like acyl-CoA dehydrogenase
MNFGYTKEEEEFRKKLNIFLDKEMTAELARQNWDDLGVGVEGREFSKKLYKNGFLGLPWPKKYGGQEMSPTYDFILVDELGKRWGAHVPLDIGYSMVGHTILRRGSEEQKQEFIPRIIRGEIEFGLGYTEPNAGSDLASMMMKAEEKEDHFIINGQKTFNTESHYADYHWLAARTENDPGKAKYKGISLFIVDQRSPGIDIRPMITMSGERTNEVYYDDVKVPKNRLIGEKNKGFYYIMEAIDSERNHVFSPSRLWPIVKDLIAYTKEAAYLGKPLLEDKGIQNKIAWMAIELEVAQILADNARWLELNELPITMEPEITKVFLSELEQRMVDDAMQVLGLYGQLNEHSKYTVGSGRIEWRFRHSYVPTIGAGTNEIGRNIIAQRGLGLPRG